MLSGTQPLQLYKNETDNRGKTTKMVTFGSRKKYEVWDTFGNIFISIRKINLIVSDADKSVPLRENGQVWQTFERLLSQNFMILLDSHNFKYNFFLINNNEKKKKPISKHFNLIFLIKIIS